MFVVCGLDNVLDRFLIICYHITVIPRTTRICCVLIISFCIRVNRYFVCSSTHSISCHL